jgi:hypothetical protein
MIVHSGHKYDCIKVFEIIATDECGYFLYVPEHLYLQGASRIDTTRCKKLGVKPQFFNEMMVYIMENMIDKISQQLDGATCCKCHQFYGYAVGNQPDGTLICFSCRAYPSYF